MSHTALAHAKFIIINSKIHQHHQQQNRPLNGWLNIFNLIDVSNCFYLHT
jgi:hypothetical protein